MAGGGQSAGLPSRGYEAMRHNLLETDDDTEATPTKTLYE